MFSMTTDKVTHDATRFCWSFPVTNFFMTRRCKSRFRNVDTDPCWVGVDSCSRCVTLPVFFQVCYSCSRWQTRNSLFHGGLVGIAEGFVAAIPENSTLSPEKWNVIRCSHGLPSWVKSCLIDMHRPKGHRAKRMFMTTTPLDSNLMHDDE